MNVTLLSDIARRRLVRRSIRLLAPAMLLTPLFVAERAEAACTPPSPVNNTTVSCPGTTTNANGTNGYGTATDVGNTYNIASGATLTGTGTGPYLTPARSDCGIRPGRCCSQCSHLQWFERRTDHRTGFKWQWNLRRCDGLGQFRSRSGRGERHRRQRCGDCKLRSDRSNGRDRYRNPQRYRQNSEYGYDLGLTGYFRDGHAVCR